MTRHLTEIFRHPIKSHGRERLEKVTLTAGKTMPWDRVWAVAHEMAKADGSEWAACANFSRGSKAPALMAISAQLDEATETLTLYHPSRPNLTFRPDDELEVFLDWVRPLMPEGRAQSARILRVPDRGMTDTPFPSISLNGHSSLRALGEKLGKPTFAQERFRGNLWFEGLGPWEEFEWVGKTVQLGDVQMNVVERIERCMATTANPATGARDATTLDALRDGWGHQDFGVYAEVTKGGTIKIGDEIEVLG